MFDPPIWTRLKRNADFPRVLAHEFADLFPSAASADGWLDRTTVHHFGFSVPDRRPLVAKIKANGFNRLAKLPVA
jgi:hypothetical protein